MFCKSTILLCVLLHIVLALASRIDAFTAENNGWRLKGQKVPIDLQSQHYVLSPAETMRSIAASCEELDIHSFDVYGDFSGDSKTSYLRKFEAEVASSFGKDDAVFMPSGVMAQNIALLIHDRKAKDELRGRFMCHHTSHLLLWEEDSYSKLLGMDAIVVDTRPTDRPTFSVPPIQLSDILTALNEEATGAGPFCVILELPHREIGGKLTPWNDVLEIGHLCKKSGIKLHCDGARIFEASAGYDKSLEDLAMPFDSIYISFYKGLGSVSGAMLMGSEDFCNEARLWLRRFGGNLYTLLPYAVSCWAGYKRHVLASNKSMSFDEKFKKLQMITKKIKAETNFSNIASFDPATPETNMIHVYIKLPHEDCVKIRDTVAKKSGYNLFSRLKEVPESDTAFESGFRAKFEWTLGEANGSIDDEVFIQVWREFSSLARNTSSTYSEEN